MDKIIAICFVSVLTTSSIMKKTFLQCQIFLFYKFENVNPHFMVKGKKEMTNVKDVLHKNLTLPLIAYMYLQSLREHGRHAMLSFLSSLPIPVLRILDMEANKFYDSNHQMYEAALLTICFTQHALDPLIDSEINHKNISLKSLS